MNSFEQEWRKFHGELPPLAFALREMSGGPWVRFHALPDSKRKAPFWEGYTAPNQLTRRKFNPLHQFRRQIVLDVGTCYQRALDRGGNFGLRTGTLSRAD